jgi:hypothetical protein
VACVSLGATQGQAGKVLMWSMAMFSVIFIGVAARCGPRELVSALQWTHQSGYELPWPVSHQGLPRR